ncbi:MAG: methyltransferase domain-containing protein [Pseudomonadota bacterium]|nr:methyltransferase domain-containing protein [Pseudomonadota bacterium]
MNQGFQKFLQTWYQTPKGQLLFKQESQLVKKAITNLFGYYLVQLGCTASHEWLLASRVSNKLVLDDVLDVKMMVNWQLEINKENHEAAPIHWVKTDLDYLPIGTESADVMLLPHTLETVQDPYYLLRQVDTMLVPEGHIVLTGFNPLACGVMKSKLGKDGQLFRNANLVRASRVTEWLTVLGYDIEYVEFSTISCYSGTTSGHSFSGWRLLERIETKLNRMGLQFGNVYCIVARKRVDAPTMVGLTWKKARWLGLVKGRQVVSNSVSKKSQHEETTLK